jgi:hypothetical protein
LFLQLNYLEVQIFLELVQILLIEFQNHFDHVQIKSKSDVLDQIYLIQIQLEQSEALQQLVHHLSVVWHDLRQIQLFKLVEVEIEVHFFLQFLRGYNELFLEQNFDLEVHFEAV